jgi:thiosulfate dehydrogenase (quinone) large subunit
VSISHQAPSRPAAPVTGHAGARGAVDYVFALTRISLGFVFMWAFLDKLFGLGHETASKSSWINGGSPTKGFLSHSAGPFSGIFKDMAGNTIVDWLFMLALVGLGTALILGIGMRLAAVAGTLLLVMMWAAVLPPANNVFMDDHLIYAMVIIALALVGAGRTVGLGDWWSRTTLVTRNPWLI